MPTRVASLFQDWLHVDKLHSAMSKALVPVPSMLYALNVWFHNLLQNMLVHLDVAQGFCLFCYQPCT